MRKNYSVLFVHAMTYTQIAALYMMIMDCEFRMATTEMQNKFMNELRGYGVKIIHSTNGVFDGFLGGCAGVIHQLIVSPDARKNGVGTRLLESFEQNARFHKLQTVETKHLLADAMPFYTRNNYQLMANKFEMAKTL
jgi:GNAT superfamily N-acetyltransferase